ncbi:hypothetical protein EBZ38_16175 [bacterium]|nr:hypothetical protein [bacterium]
MGAHKKNILKLQNYVLDKNQAGPAGPCQQPSAGEQLRNGGSVGSGNGQIVYPLVFADVQSATTDAGTLDLVVGVYFSDRVESIKPMGGVVSGSPTLGWQDNEDEVLSDQLQIAQDFISSLTNDPSEDWTLSSSVSLTRFVESRDDRTAGWQATMTFEIPFGHSVCEIPT